MITIKTTSRSSGKITQLAGCDFDILPTAEIGLGYFHRFRKKIYERTLIVAQALVRALGAMRLYIYVVIRKITESGYCFFGCGVI